MLINKGKKVEIISQINNELQLRSFRISEEDYNKLLKIQNETCRKLEWIELNQDKVSEIINPFLSNAYLNEYSYMTILQQAIIQYYQFRSQYNWQIADNYLIEVIYQIFDIYGSFENDFEYKLIKMLNESGKINGE